MTVEHAKRRIRAITGCSDMDARCILMRMLDSGRWLLTPDRQIVRVESKP